MKHTPHPHIEKRKKYAKAAVDQQKTGFNNWLAVKITNVVGTMWCAYAFTILALVSLPDAIKGGRSTLVAWIAQTFLQLVLLSIIMVGQKVAAAGSDRQLQQTYDDAEALLQITDEMHKLLKQNTTLTERIDELVSKITEKDK
jgi:ABC-type nickel/cobalt efflux system permease component RcnA